MTTRVMAADAVVAVEPTAGSFAAMSVADLPASVQWYRKNFGLSQSYHYRSDDAAMQIVVLSGVGLTIELQQHQAAQAMPAPQGKAYLRQGIFKFGVQVTDLQQAIRTLEAAGAPVVVRPFKDPNGQLLSAVVQDNSGNLLQLLQKTSP